MKALLESGQEEPPPWFRDVAGVPLLSPGEKLSTTRELEAGTYVFLCFIPSPQGVSHVNLGMLRPLVLSGDSGAELPEPNAVITASADGYAIPDLDGGPQTIELRNEDEKEREFFLVTLDAGKRLEDLDRFFEEEEGKGDPPADFHAAMQTIPAGHVGVPGYRPRIRRHERRPADRAGYRPVNGAVTHARDTFHARLTIA